MQGTGFESWHGQFSLRGIYRPWSALLNPSHFPVVSKTGITGAYLGRLHVPGQQFSAVRWGSYTTTVAVRPVDRLQVAGRPAGRPCLLLPTFPWRTAQWHRTSGHSRKTYLVSFSFIFSFFSLWAGLTKYLYRSWKELDGLGFESW